MIWLASFPRSGNTFFRIAMYEVYGIESSAFHTIPNNPFDENYEDYSLVKTHLLPHQLVPDDPNIPAIYIVRDGRDALVSIAHQRKDLIEPGTDFMSNLREAIVAAEGSYFGGWSYNVLQWLERATIVIKFEELITNPIEEMERIRPWLEMAEPQLEKVPTFNDMKSKEMKYGSGLEMGYSPEELTRRRKLFFRRGKIGSWKKDMPEDFHKLFWDLHGEAMRRMGYTDGEIKPKTRWQLLLEKAGNRLAGRYR